MKTEFPGTFPTLEGTPSSLLLKKLKERYSNKEEILELLPPSPIEPFESFLQHLSQKGTVPEEELYSTIAELFSLPFRKKPEIPEKVREKIRSLSLSSLRNHQILPLSWDEEKKVVEVGIANPLNREGIEWVEGEFSSVALLTILPPSAIQSSLNEIFGEAGDTAEEVILELKDEGEGEGLEGAPLDLLEQTDEDAPIIRLVNRLLFQAIRDRASDIHIEPFEQEVVVRFRIDGVLHPVLRPPKRIQPTIVSRIKIMAGLNIAEKRLPQDGRIRLRIAGRDIDVRVSTLPTTHGERIVLRLLDRSQVITEIDQLGFNPELLRAWRSLIRRPYGILLVTGPTGSGKTTTLYASLNEINKPDLNIITIEDPVEYQLKGIGQIPVNPKIGLTFAHGLRTILRQDPDVILVGEIRDLETAEIAIQASLTGHLVFSTLHTNDAPSAITRLTDMGIEPYLVASSLLGVLAQRLVRTLCPYCKVPVSVSPEALRELTTYLPREPITIYEKKGCIHCKGTGYRGRAAIGELLRVTDLLRQTIVQTQDANSIRKIATEQGMKTLREDGALKVFSGVTTVEEVLRVTQEELPEELN